MCVIKHSLSSFAILLCILVNNRSFSQKLIPPPFVMKEWEMRYQPFRIVGNLYYVGTYDLACYLIVTSEGNILINTGLAESVSDIRSNVEALGFKFSDIKILLATHAHFDHVAGMADIKLTTGAQMMINKKDAQALADGGNSDFIFGGKGSTFKPLKADRLLEDNDTVQLGDMKLAVLNHPGHTQGANSFLFDVKDGTANYRVLIANMPTMQDQTDLKGMVGYKEIAKDYAFTFDALKKLSFDIWLSSHAAQFRLHQKHKPGDPYHPKVFIDREGYDRTVDNLEKLYLRRLNQ
ncbi:MAG TPA: subclass B3 metallo-beta-lactamase [Chitinophagaceae bacterium]